MMPSTVRQIRIMIFFCRFVPIQDIHTQTTSAREDSRWMVVMVVVRGFTIRLKYKIITR